MAQILVIALIGAGLFLWGWFQYRKVQASQAWPYTPGRILAARVERSVSMGNQEEADSISYSPMVQYEYLVADQRYVGNRIAFAGKGYARPAQAEKALQPYPIGASVWVFFDPAKPSDAVLIRKAPGGKMIMVLGGIMVVLAIVAAFK